MSHNNYDDRHYVIISSDDALNIDFDQVMETSIDTVRYNVEETLTFVKYEGDMPSSVSACESRTLEYSHDEILVILGGTDWTPEGII